MLRASARSTSGFGYSGSSTPKALVQTQLAKNRFGLRGRLPFPLWRRVIAEPELPELHRSLHVQHRASRASVPRAPCVHERGGREEENVSAGAVGVVPPSGRRIRKV